MRNYRIFKNKFATMLELFTEKTKNSIELPKNSSLINYSVLNEFYSTKPYRSFSIKYVVQGEELYAVNGNKYLLRNGDYLLANNLSEGYAEVDSKLDVKGICIDVAPDILSEVLATYMLPNETQADLSLGTFFHTTQFLEQKYKANQTQLGQVMLALERKLAENPSLSEALSKEFYYCVAEKIVADHIPVIHQLQTIKAVKSETRKTLLRRVMKGKQFLDDFFTKAITIEQVAQNVALSEYHFLRLFKSVYNISPYQYIILKRLNYAKSLLEREKISITTLALLTGFSDVHGFSKAFKKHFGYTPSDVKKNFI